MAPVPVAGVVSVAASGEAVEEGSGAGVVGSKLLAVAASGEADGAAAGEEGSGASVGGAARGAGVEGGKTCGRRK